MTAHRAAKPRRTPLVVLGALVAACSWVAVPARVHAQVGCDQPRAPIFAERSGSRMIVDGEEVWTVLGQHQVWPEEPVEPPVTLGEAGRWPAVEWSLDGDRDLVTVVGERAGEYAIPEPVGPMPAVEGEQVDVTYQGRYLVLRQVWWTVGRPLHLLVVWNVEDLCVPSPVVTTTTVVAPSTTIVECLCAPPLPGPAPTPAVPVRTTAAYTG